MIENDKAQCKLLAFLLDYPNDSWRADLPAFGTAVNVVTTGARRDRLQSFLTYAASTPSLELQETYTSAFDLDPAASLHLTYHLLGDSEDRGKALAKILWLYHQEGYDAIVGELPDYLPMMLEFLSFCPKPKNASLLWSCLGTVEALAERLEKNQHPYAGLLGVANDILQPCISSEGISKEV